MVSRRIGLMACVMVLECLASECFARGLVSVAVAACACRSDCMSIVQASDTSCTVSNVRAVSFVGDDVELGMGAVIEWDPPPGLFAGAVGQFYYWIRTLEQVDNSWADANAQEAVAPLMAGEDLSALPPGTTRALILNGNQNTIIPNNQFTFLVHTRNLNCDSQFQACSDLYQNANAWDRFEYLGKTQGPILTMRASVQPPPASAISVNITTRSSVTFALTPPSSPLEEPEFQALCRVSGDEMAGWNNADVIVQTSIASEARNGAITVHGLEEGTLYDFKIFARNRHMDAWEDLGSPAISARPLRPASVVRQVRIVEVNETSVRLSFTRPEEVVALSGYRVSRLMAPDSHIGVLPTVDHVVVAQVSTTNMGFEEVFATVYGLQSGEPYHLAVQAINPGGGGTPARITVRPFGKSTGPEGFTAQMASSTAVVLSWRAPTDLGQPSGLQVYGYEVVAVLPPGAHWGEAGSRIVPVGSTLVSSSSEGTFISHALDNATVLEMEMKFLTYGVFALVEQDLSLGGGRVRGSASVTSVSVGRRPSWSGETPPDGKLLVAWIGKTVMVPLEVSDPGIAVGEGVRFELFGALPPQSSLGTSSSSGERLPGAVELDTTTSKARTYLSLKGTVQLAGSRYKICLWAIDTTNLTTNSRCFNMQIPRPTPHFISPPNNSTYASAVGCRLVIPLAAEDRTSLDLDPALGASNGYGVTIQALYTFVSSRYKSLKSEGLPQGAALAAPGLVSGINMSRAASSLSMGDSFSGSNNPAVTFLEWVARKGQEGFLYRLCLVAIDSSKAFSSMEGGARTDNEQIGQIFCLNVNVQRCRYCPRELDSVHSVAKEWHSAWLEVWSGNHMYTSPDLLPNFNKSPPLQSHGPDLTSIGSTPVLGEIGPPRNVFNPLEVGVVYAVEEQDDLWHVAQRFGIDMNDILFWNPDLADGHAQQQQYQIFRSSFQGIAQFCSFNIVL